MVTLKSFVIEYVDPASLVIDNTLKMHPIEMLEISFDEFGYSDPIVVTEDNIVVAGHGRLEAALSAKSKSKPGFDTVPVIRLPFTHTDALAYSIADDRSYEDGRWNETKLKSAVAKLITDGYDISKTGFTTEELNDIANDCFRQKKSATIDTTNEVVKFTCATCGARLKRGRNGNISIIEKEKTSVEDGGQNG